MMQCGTADDADAGWSNRRPARLCLSSRAQASGQGKPLIGELLLLGSPQTSAVLFLLLLSPKMSLQTAADKMAPGSGAAHFTAVFADPSVPINLYSEFMTRHCWTFAPSSFLCSHEAPLCMCR